MKLQIPLIKKCKTIHQIHQFHAHVLTQGLLFLSPCHVLTTILYTVTTLKPTSPSPSPSPSPLPSYALSVFKSLPYPSTFTYNTIIRAHTLFSSPLNAVVLFSRMRTLSVPPDSYSFPFLLKACSRIGSYPLAQTIHSHVLKIGFLADVFVLNSLMHVYSLFHRMVNARRLFDESLLRDVVSYNTLIDGYVKLGDLPTARELFDEMPFRDSMSWGTLIAGYAGSDDQCGEAIKLFIKMMDSEIKPDNVALVSVLSACAQLGELEQGKKVRHYIEHNQIRVDSFLSTGLVDFYAKCGDIKTAIDIFESSKDKNLFTWNAMLVGLAMHGMGKLSIAYFSRMVEARIEPDGVTLLGVLVGCSHAGLVDEARKLFDEMESVYRIPKELKHYGCMADLLSRAGLIEEAMEMIRKMPMGGDVFVWSGLLGGCRIHGGNVEIAEEAAEQVMKLRPEDGGVYKILADVYANANRWDDVVRIRRSMDAAASGKIKKSAGCSWIQLHGATHEFVAGDCLHPDTGEIHWVLDGIRRHQLESF